MNLDLLWKILDTQATWVRYAERKALAIFALTAGTTGALTTALRTLPHPGVVGYVLVALALVCQVATALVTCTVLAPRTRHRQHLPAGEDVIYFGDIAAGQSAGKGIEEYATELCQAITRPEVFARITARQIHALALVAHKKTRAARAAMVMLAVTAALTAASLIVWTHG